MVYFVNKNYVGWVQQHVIGRIYIELKIKGICNRSRIRNSINDQSFCLYCTTFFVSKLCLTNYKIYRYFYGLVNSNGLKIKMFVYPNFKIIQQKKDLKATLQDVNIEQFLRIDYTWLAFNHEQHDHVISHARIRIIVRIFMEDTIHVTEAL